MTDETIRKARLIVFDAETYRTRNPRFIETIREEAIAKRPAQNTLKELKVEWDTDAAREARAAEALAKTSLDVLLAEPLCVCWKTDVKDARTTLNLMITPEELDGDNVEACQLTSLAREWNDLAGPETIWIGHNVIGFDLPILLNRWRRYGIRPPEHFPTFNGRWHGRIYDTMLRTPTKTGFVSLDTACAAHHIEIRAVPWQGEPLDGSRVGAAFEAGEHNLILTHCIADVDACWQLYMAMTCDDTWGTYDAQDQIAAAVTEIECSLLTSSAKAIAILQVLDRAGLIPRVAA